MSKNMNGTEKRSYLLLLLIINVFAVCFVTVMGYLNYRSTAIELEEQVIARIEDDTVSRLETAISFGKSFENYYGMDEIFESFSSQISGTHPFVISKDGKLLYYADADNATMKKLDGFMRSSELAKALRSPQQAEGSAVVSSYGRAILTAVHNDDETVGFFGTLYSEDIFNNLMVNVREKICILTLIAGGAVAVVLYAFTMLYERRRARRKNDNRSAVDVQKVSALAIMAAGVLVASVVSIYLYQKDYKEKIVNATNISLKNLENNIRDVSNNGVELREVLGLKEYIYARVNKLDTLRAVRISERIVEVQQGDGNSDIISYVFGTEDESDATLYLEAEISRDAMNAQIRGIILTLLSTLIILLIFVIELSHLFELVGDKKSRKEVLSEHKVAVSLRLSGFLCSTAEYMCVPYAAMMIRESGESVLGLGNGLTAALPLTLEGFTQMIAMLTLPRLLKKKDMRSILVVSSVAMILCNIGAFSLHTAAAIIAFRALAGIAYAGFKQISNYLITRGYESETGRSNNISQDNAGLLAGATCGAGLGAIICANMGYPITFFISAMLFVVYLLITFTMMPWKALAKRGSMDQEEKPVSISSLKKMIFSAEMLFYVIFVGIPLNIGVMLCVTLVPAICQSNGISSVMLSYCYIANGIAGIYIGPALVSRAKKKLGLMPCIAISFLLAAAGIFVLKLPGVVVMIVISSTVLGFLDGFGTPVCTDTFMELKVVKNAVDESTALIFSVVISYILLTFAPMIAEAMLIPGEGIFSPMMIGTGVYVIAAIAVSVYGAANKNFTKKNLTF